MYMLNIEGDINILNLENVLINTCLEQVSTSFLSSLA